MPIVATSRELHWEAAAPDPALNEAPFTVGLSYSRGFGLGLSLGLGVGVGSLPHGLRHCVDSMPRQHWVSVPTRKQVGSGYCIYAPIVRLILRVCARITPAQWLRV
jgi:hypothetical protein